MTVFLVLGALPRAKLFDAFGVSLNLTFHALNMHASRLAVQLALTPSLDSAFVQAAYWGLFERLKKAHAAGERS